MMLTLVVVVISSISYGTGQGTIEQVFTRSMLLCSLIWIIMELRPTATHIPVDTQDSALSSSPRTDILNLLAELEVPPPLSLESWQETDGTDLLTIPTNVDAAGRSIMATEATVMTLIPCLETCLLEIRQFLQVVEEGLWWIQNAEKDPSVEVSGSTTRPPCNVADLFEWAGPSSSRYGGQRQRHQIMLNTLQLIFSWLQRICGSLLQTDGTPSGLNNDPQQQPQQQQEGNSAVDFGDDNAITLSLVLSRKAKLLELLSRVAQLVLAHKSGKDESKKNELQKLLFILSEVTYLATKGRTYIDAFLVWGVGFDDEGSYDKIEGHDSVSNQNFNPVLSAGQMKVEALEHLAGVIHRLDMSVWALQDEVRSEHPQEFPRTSLSLSSSPSSSSAAAWWLRIQAMIELLQNTAKHLDQECFASSPTNKEQQSQLSDSRYIGEKQRSARNHHHEEIKQNEINIVSATIVVPVAQMHRTPSKALNDSSFSFPADSINALHFYENDPQANGSAKSSRRVLMLQNGSEERNHRDEYNIKETDQEREGPEGLQNRQRDKTHIATMAEAKSRSLQVWSAFRGELSLSMSDFSSYLKQDEKQELQQNHACCGYDRLISTCMQMMASHKWGDGEDDE